MRGHWEKLIIEKKLFSICQPEKHCQKLSSTRKSAESLLENNSLRS